MKIWLGIIILALAGAGYWFTQSKDSDNGGAVVPQAPSENAAADVTTVEETDPATELSDSEIESGNQMVNAVDTVGEAIAVEQVLTEEESPFSLVQPDQTIAEAEDTTDSIPAITTSSAQDTQQTSLVSPRLIYEPVIVPQSYPVTDAAKYFVPREERRPGNLGGPPPLDFPGGPSDPARQDTGGFPTPRAPGQ